MFFGRGQIKQMMTQPPHRCQELLLLSPNQHRTTKTHGHREPHMDVKAGSVMAVRTEETPKHISNRVCDQPDADLGIPTVWHWQMDHVLGHPSQDQV